MSKKNEIKNISNTPEEIKEAEVSNDLGLNQNLKYTGNVNIKIVSNGRVKYSSARHNAGSDSLFKFFANCLAGNYSDAEKLRPKTLQLYNNSSDNPTEITDPMENATPLCAIQLVNDIDVSGTTTSLHFTIPKSQITSDLNLNQLVLRSLTDDGDNYSAYFFLTKDNSGTTVWDPIKLSDYSSNTTLIIEWTLSVGN